MFDYVHTQLNSNCITTSKKTIKTKPALKKGGFCFYLLTKVLNSISDKRALTTDATMTASTAIS